MSANKAIEFINTYTCNAYGSWDINTRYKKEKVIELLQRGEKFEEMWEEFEVYIEGKSKALTNKMNMLRQKYFPEKSYE